MAQVKATPEKVIEIALADVGYLEKKSNSQLDDKTANAGDKNYTKFAKIVDDIPSFYNTKKQGVAWCDIWYDTLHIRAFGAEAAKKLLCQPDKSSGAGCYYSAQYYKARKQFHTKNPKPGDQIFFWNAKKASVAHTGLVYKVDNSYVYTIEGNTSSASGVVANGGGVFTKKYLLTYNRIYGYGRPAYDSVTYETPDVVETEEKEETKKNITDLAKEVLAGKWGNGSVRKTKLTNAGYDYSTVQAEVNRILCGKKTSYAIAQEVIAGRWGNGAIRMVKLTAAGYSASVVQGMVNELLKGGR